MNIFQVVSIWVDTMYGDREEHISSTFFSTKELALKQKEKEIQSLIENGEVLIRDQNDCAVFSNKSSNKLSSNKLMVSIEEHELDIEVI